MTTLWQDIRYGFRMLRKTPGFTVVAVLTLILCLGANLTIFSVVDSVLLRPLPFPSPDRLVTMFNSYPKLGQDRTSSSFLNYYSRRDGIAAFSSVSAFVETTAVIGEAGSTELTEICRVSPEFFTTLGVQPRIGRPFTEEEMTYQTDGVVMLTDRYWRQKFNADPNVLGSSLRVDGLPKVIVGVLPTRFRFLSSKARIFHPLSSDSDERGIRNLHSPRVELIARLRPGATLVQAQSQIDVHNAIMAKDFPYLDLVAKSGFRTVVTPLHADHVAAIRPTIVLLQAGVFSLLLIGGANLINLLLIRVSGRVRELAIRQSLGADHWHLVRHVMIEIILIGIVGGLGGLVTSAIGIRLLMALGVEQLPLGAQITFDGRLAVVALLGSVSTGIVLGIPIVWFTLRDNPALALQSESRSGTISHAAHRLRHGFIVCQIALAFVLLVGAGLLALSLDRAMKISTGFRVENVLTGRISLPWKTYPDSTPRLEFVDRLMAEVKQISGVTAAGVITDVPVNGSHDFDVMTIDGFTTDPGVPLVTHYVYWVAGDYFTTMGIPLRAGRFFTDADLHSDVRTCVVDEDFARFYWPEGNVIGRQVYRGVKEEGDKPFTVIGVVGRVKQTNLTNPKAGRAVYFPYRFETANKLYVVASTRIPPENLNQTLQTVVRKIDPELPIYDLRSMEVRIADSLIVRRSPTLLAGIFAAVALLLASVGTYGVLAYAVRQRYREIGVRIALGASPGQIRRQFLCLGSRLLGLGMLFGGLGALLTGKVMEKVLFKVAGFDIPTFTISVAIMCFVTLIACYIPARRAAKVDPMEVLRYE